MVGFCCCDEPSATTPCGDCSGEPSDFYIVKFPAAWVSDPGALCDPGVCDDMNELEVMVARTGLTLVCQWLYEWPGPPFTACSPGTLVMTMAASTSPSLSITIQFRINDDLLSSQYIEWSYSSLATNDCTFTTLNIPFDTDLLGTNYDCEQVASPGDLVLTRV